jgi:hypothetical protein
MALPGVRKVGFLDLSSMEVVKTLDVPKAPQEVLLRPDGRVAYVSCDASGQVAEIDLDRMKVARLIAAGPMADGLAWAAQPSPPSPRFAASLRIERGSCATFRVGCAVRESHGEGRSSAGARREEGPMTLRTVLLSCALTLPAGVVPGPPAAKGDEKPKAAPASADLSGRWVFNQELSDDAREKMREARERGGGPGGGRPPTGSGGGGMGGDDDPREATRAVFEPAEELTVTQDATQIGVEEKFGRTRRLHPDGKKYKTDNGASEIKSSWKEGKLVVETKSLRGGRVLETWERIPDGSRLIVNVKMEGGFGPGLTLKRVYDRAAGESPK